jgi:uncharacterized RDD family membrane protein YckC
MGFTGIIVFSSSHLITHNTGRHSGNQMTKSTTLHLSTRLGSMICDQIVMTVICTLFFIPGLLRSAFQIMGSSDDLVMLNPFGGIYPYIILIGFALYFCKDSFKGRSLGKHITRLQVLDNATGQVATPLQCLVRNLFCAIWPIEVIVTLINPERRIGDRVAGTRVALYDPNHVPQPPLAMGKILLALLITYGAMVLIFLPFAPAFNRPTTPPFVSSSYNATASQSLEKLYSDSLGRYLKPSIKIYDTVSGRAGKYISAIFYLKANFLEDEEQARELRRLVLTVLHKRYPPDSYTGVTKYIYKDQNNTQIHTTQIGNANP